MKPLSSLPGYASFFALVYASTLSGTANAEISSLTTEELTDTYIRDTTVIVQKSEPSQQQEPAIPVTLKVTPLEKGAQLLPDDPTHTISSISPELTSYTDELNQIELDSSLLLPPPNSTTEFIRPGPSDEGLAAVRAAYGIADDEPIDLTSFTFDNNVVGTALSGANLPNGTGVTANGQSFTISIPNTGNFRQQTITSPNGEIGVRVTPGQIQYTINLPQ